MQRGDSKLDPRDQKAGKQSYSLFILERHLERLAYAISWPTAEYCFNIDVLFTNPFTKRTPKLPVRRRYQTQDETDVHGSCALATHRLCIFRQYLPFAAGGTNRIPRCVRGSVLVANRPTTFSTTTILPLAEDAMTSHAQSHGDVRVTFRGKPSPIRLLFVLGLRCWSSPRRGPLYNPYAPSTSGHIVQSFASPKHQSFPVMLPLRRGTRPKWTRLPCQLLLRPPSDIGYNITPTYIVRIYQGPHASLAIPNSLPTRPIKPHQYPEISPLKSLLMVFVSLLVCLPSTRRAHAILLILSVRSLYLDH